MLGITWLYTTQLVQQKITKKEDTVSPSRLHTNQYTVHNPSIYHLSDILFKKLKWNYYFCCCCSNQERILQRWTAAFSPCLMCQPSNVIGTKVLQNIVQKRYIFFFFEKQKKNCHIQLFLFQIQHHHGKDVSFFFCISSIRDKHKTVTLYPFLFIFHFNGIFVHDSMVIKDMNGRNCDKNLRYPFILLSSLFFC